MDGAGNGRTSGSGRLADDRPTTNDAAGSIAIRDTAIRRQMVDSWWQQLRQVGRRMLRFEAGLLGNLRDLLFAQRSLI